MANNFEAESEKIDQLKQEVKNYTYEIKSLKIKLYDLLKHLNSNSEYLGLVVDKVSHTQLPISGEIDYIIEQIYTVYDHISEADKKNFNQLKADQQALINKCESLQESVSAQSKLLEDSEKEINRLSQQLKKEREGNKNLALQQENHKKSAAAQEKLSAEQNILLQKQAEELKNLREKLKQVDKDLTAIEIVDISDTVNSKILESTADFLYNLGQENITFSSTKDNVEQDLLNLFPEVQKTSTNSVKTQTPQISVSSVQTQTNTSGDSNNSNKNTLEKNKPQPPNPNPQKPKPIPPIKMTNGTELPMQKVIKIVRDIVPYFSGASGPDLRGEVNKFVAACKFAEQELKDISPEKIIDCVKQRLTGRAYEQLGAEKFSTLTELCNAIKKTFLTQRTLQDIRADISKCRANGLESPLHFAGRLKALLAEAKDTIAKEWQDAASVKIIEKECEYLAGRSFVAGVNDPRIQNRCIGHEKEGLNKLLELTEQIEGWLVTPKINNSMDNQDMSQIVCKFCNSVGHAWANCVKRLNSKYCTKCGVYFHEIGPDCKTSKKAEVLAIFNESCEVCKKQGHNKDNCNFKLSQLFCYLCNVKGHQTNRFCAEKRQQNRQNNFWARKPQQQQNFAPRNDFWQQNQPRQQNAFNRQNNHIATPAHNFENRNSNPQHQPQDNFNTKTQRFNRQNNVSNWQPTPRQTPENRQHDRNMSFQTRRFNNNKNQGNFIRPGQGQ